MDRCSAAWIAKARAAPATSLPPSAFVRSPDPADGRRALLELTESGREKLAAERRNREGWLIQAIADGLSEPEQRVLVQAVELLRRLAESQGTSGT